MTVGFEMMRGPVHAPEPVHDCPVTAVAGRDPRIAAGRSAALRRGARGAFRAGAVPGGHVHPTGRPPFPPVEAAPSFSSPAFSSDRPGDRGKPYGGVGCA